MDQTSAKATNGGYKGVNVLTTRNSTNKEYAQYLAVMKKYAKGVDTGGVAPGGYTSVLALVTALPNLTGDVTQQTISAGMAVDGADAAPARWRHHLPVQRDQQVSLAPPICSTQVLKAKYTAKAVPVGFKVFDTSTLSKLG